VAGVTECKVSAVLEGIYKSSPCECLRNEVSPSSPPEVASHLIRRSILLLIWDFNKISQISLSLCCLLENSNSSPSLNHLAFQVFTLLSSSLNSLSSNLFLVNLWLSLCLHQVPGPGSPLFAQ
jgi:hypothetical protein